MKYSLVQFRVHLIVLRLFVIYTDHAPLRTATQSPHLSQFMDVVSAILFSRLFDLVDGSEDEADKSTAPSSQQDVLAPTSRPTDDSAGLDQAPTT